MEPAEVEGVEVGEPVILRQLDKDCGQPSILAMSDESGRTMRGMLAGLLTAIVSGPAFAATTLPLEGRVNSTYDPNTGLEWLNLDQTAGQSYQSVLAGWNGYTTAQGYRFATRDEIVTLFLHAGAVNVIVARLADLSDLVPENVPAAELLFSLMGETYTSTDLRRSRMFYDPGSEPEMAPEYGVPVAVFGILSYFDEEGFFGLLPIFHPEDDAAWDLSSALVRSVPEPSGAVMVLIAPLALLRRVRP